MKCVNFSFIYCPLNSEHEFQYYSNNENVLIFSSIMGYGKEDTEKNTLIL